MTQVMTAQASHGPGQVFHHFGEGRTLNLYFSGAFDNGRVILEALSPDGSAWVPLAGGVFTEPGLHVLEAAPFVGRLTLANTTSEAASLNAWVESDDISTWQRVHQHAQAAAT